MSSENKIETKGRAYDGINDGWGDPGKVIIVRHRQHDGTCGEWWTAIALTVLPEGDRSVLKSGTFAERWQAEGWADEHIDFPHGTPWRGEMDAGEIEETVRQHRRQKPIYVVGTNIDYRPGGYFDVYAVEQTLARALEAAAGGLARTNRRIGTWTGNSEIGPGHRALSGHVSWQWR